MIALQGQEVFLRRRARLVERFAAWEIDALVVTFLPNIRYLTGFSGSHALLVVTAEGGVIVSDGRYQEQIAAEVSGLEIEIQGNRKDHQALFDALKRYQRDLKHLGLEADRITLARYETFAANNSGYSLIPTKGVVEGLRRSKDEGEIERIQHALHIAENALESARESIREGMTERELAHEIEHHMWLHGAEKESFDSLVLFGPRSSLPHGKPGNREIQKGNIILTDFGCMVDGYCSDITRTCCVGPAPNEFDDAYQAVREAVLRAESAVKAGVLCSEIDAVARGYLNSVGRGDQFIHSTGHGVGLEIHEAPRLSVIGDEVLVSGDLITIEPGVYIEGWGGIRIEDMIVVREGGYERLNQSSIEPEILDIM